MNARAELAETAPGLAGTRINERRSRHFLQTLPGLLLGQATALALQALAVLLARQSLQPTALVLSHTAVTVGYASALLVLVAPGLTRASRNTAILCLGLTTTLLCRALNPLLFTGYDEQLHLRTLGDIISSHGLFAPNALLAVSPHYPGLEALTALFQQTGLPTRLAATVVVIIAHLVLVFSLCDATEQFTGSMRAGGLAVAVYAVSPQFVSFNSQFSYQTLALPLAVTAVALIGRSRHVADARLLFTGAAVCLLAVAATHHVTSLLTAIFLLLWTAASRGSRTLRRTFLGALVALASTGAWALVQWSLLRQYFGPILDDVATQVMGGSAERKLFSDPAGVATPAWERVFLVLYAAVISTTATVLVLDVFWQASRRSRLAKHARPSRAEAASASEKLMALLTLLVPVVFAVRAMPSGAEFGDRATSFLFLPFSVLTAAMLVRATPKRLLANGTARGAVLVLASLTFLGGYLLGSGPDWARLPGPYLPVADNRSIDAETLAAARWVGDHLPQGSRITADRVGADLLSGEAGMWPVLKEAKWDAAALYFADEWSSYELATAQHLRLNYVYVDQRWADRLPHMGHYFHNGETPELQQLTTRQLTKFDHIPGIVVVYRHGPVSVYDISRLGIPVQRTGWAGQRPAPAVWIQLAVGLLVGLALVLAARRREAGALIRAVREFRTSAGTFLTLGAAVGASCLLAVVLLLLHVWLGPATFAMAAAVVLITERRRLPLWRRPVIRPIRVQWRATTALLAAAGLTAIAGAAAITSDYSSHVSEVRSILDDPSAVHQGTR